MLKLLKVVGIISVGAYVASRSVRYLDEQRVAKLLEQGRQIRSRAKTLSERAARESLWQAVSLYRSALALSNSLSLRHDALSGWCDTLDQLGRYTEAETICQNYGLTEMRQQLRGIRHSS